MRKATLVRADRARVFDALATSEGLNKWFTTTSLLDPRSGGAIELRWREWGAEQLTVAVDGQVIAYERPSRFVFDWWTAGDPSDRTRIEILFTERPDGTLVDLSESGYPPSDMGLAALVRTASGWGEALTLMKFSVEHGVRY